MFSEEQEGYLGDFFEELTRRTMPVYQQQGLTAPLDAIAARLLRNLPRNAYNFKFTIVELPTANAFAMPGGRIFVSRLLISAMQNEDELAGILAHEMGHVLARQGSVEFSKLLRDVTKVTQLGDRADVYAKMNALLDESSRRKKRGNKEEEHQLEADRVSSMAMWRAGYDPEAFPRAFDRITANNGARGNFFTDLIGSTGSVSKRYREMLKSVQDVPGNCRQPRDTAEDSAFQLWRKRVSDLAPEDLLTTLSSRQADAKLVPALRPDLSNIRFSPDGRTLLAQDDAAISILQREPLQVLFRIPALGAGTAIFHKDAQNVLFRTSTGRIEMWNIGRKARVRRWDLPLDLDCQEILVSPDAKSIACTVDYGAGVTIVDLESGEKLARHRADTNVLVALEAILLDTRIATVAYSPDGSAFLQSPRASAFGPWAYSTTQHKEISLGRSLKNALNGSFAFMDDARIAVVPANERESGLFSFPDGRRLSTFTLPSTFLAPITRGEVLMLRPLGNYAAALVSIAEREVFQASVNAAIDRFDDFGAAERTTGEIAIYQGRSTQPVSVLQLPDGDLNQLRSATVSPDLQWLALSTATRGQIWSLSGKGSSLTPAFDGGSISPSGIWTVTFEDRGAKSSNQPGPLEKFRATVNLNTGQQVSRVRVDRRSGERLLFSGRFEIRLISGVKNEKPLLEVRDAVSGKVQWTRFFEEMPRIHLGNALVAQLDPGTKEAREMLKKHNRNDKAQDSVVLQVFHLESGAPLGDLVADVGGSIRTANVVGRTLFLEDTNNRTLSYSLDTGERYGQQFGRILAVDTAHGRIAASNRLGSVTVMDETLRTTAAFEYPRNVIFAGFDGEGKRLLVITGSQELFLENIPN